MYNNRPKNSFKKMPHQPAVSISQKIVPKPLVTHSSKLGVVQPAKSFSTSIPTGTNVGSNETSWGGVAEWYDGLVEQSPDSYQKKVLMPNLMRLLDPKPGMEILDSACGQGYFARACASHGATVTGADISNELIELAKKHTSPTKGAPTGKRITYHTAPADQLTFAKDASFDVVLIVLAIQNIENLSATFAECSRVLKSKGRLIFVLNHPAFRIPSRSSWQWDDKLGVQYRRLDGYMSDTKNKIDMTPGTDTGFMKKFTYSFHRPLQSYVKALNKSGLAITRLEEWISHKESQPGSRADEENRMRKEMPMFMCVEVVKG
jgi:ubiquinone/menaquinone biosynthesis C-methylase UbiE